MKQNRAMNAINKGRKFFSGYSIGFIELEFSIFNI